MQILQNSQENTCGIFFNEVVDLERQTLKLRFILLKDKIYVTEQSLLKNNMLKVNLTIKKMTDTVFVFLLLTLN